MQKSALSNFAHYLVLAIGGFSTALSAESNVARAVIHASDSTTLSSEISARVVDVPYREGDPFREGDLLIRFDCRMFEAQAKKVDADLRAAEVKLKNDRKLEKLGSIGVMELVLSETGLEQAKAESSMAHINVERCGIRAPWSGRVVKNLVHEFESVELHKPLITVTSSKHLEVNLVVPSDWVRWIKPGMAFNLLIDETETTHTASVLTIGSVVDPVSQTVSIRASVNQDDVLLPGMSGTAIF